MESMRVTNGLLLVIAVCLLALVARQFGLVSAASAQPPMQLVDVIGWEVSKPIAVDVQGYEAR